MAIKLISCTGIEGATVASGSIISASQLKVNSKIVDARERSGYVTVSKVEFSGKNVRVVTNSWTKVYARSESVSVLH